MRELSLLGQYLMQLRQDKLQLSHQCLLNGAEPEKARILAHEAELVHQIREATFVLDDDPGKFLDKYLKRESKE